MLSDSPEILVIGYNAFDITVPVQGSPGPDTKTEVSFIELSGGGPAATAAVALTRLGARVRLVTPLTDDPGGIIQRQELEAAGIDLSRCPLFAGHKCARAVILVQPETGERSIFWARGEIPRLEAGLWQNPWLDGVDLLYLDGHEPALSLVGSREARRRGLPVVLDAGSVRSGSAELVPLCTDVISSSVFAHQLTGLAEPLAALGALREMGPARVAMTHGAGGVLALDEAAFTVPAFKVEAVDTTGAGDVFHAGYAFELARGLGFAHCLTFGAAVAALKCTEWGGRGGLPGYSEARRMVDCGEVLPISTLFNIS